MKRCLQGEGTGHGTVARVNFCRAEARCGVVCLVVLSHRRLTPLCVVCTYESFPQDSAGGLVRGAAALHAAPCAGRSFALCRMYFQLRPRTATAVDSWTGRHQEDGCDGVPS